MAGVLMAGTLIGIALPRFLTPHATGATPTPAPRRQVINGDFESMQGWTLSAPGADASTLSFTKPDPAGGRYATHRGAQAYEVHTSQLLTGLEKGNYTLRARAHGGGGRDHLASMRVEMFDDSGNSRSVAIPVNPKAFQTIQIPHIPVTTGNCKIGFHSKAAGGRWIAFDDVALVPEK